VGRKITQWKRPEHRCSDFWRMANESSSIS
jgi:hypothetical protein